MDILKFQEMLNDICGLARKNNKSLTIEQVQGFFAEAELSREQFMKVLQYLKLKNIQIDGMEIPAAAEESMGQENICESIPLTQEEEEYLKEYLEGLACQEDDVQTSEELFKALEAGESFAKEALANRYLRKAAELAAEKNCEEIYLADLIQEANISLLSALNRVGDGEIKEHALDENWLLAQIRIGIDEAIRLQTERKFADDCLVAKVEKLEEAVRDLSEDEEGQETKFSIDELAIILDMDAEEIRDVLRLTGDDK
jgi:DNA-directed RNA polymerase sigma subunit (sigma70/sigma32)